MNENASSGTADPALNERTVHTPPPAKPKPDAPPRGFLGKLWYEWVKPLGTVILAVTLVRSSLIDWNDVPSGSMRPTILEGDRIVVNKLAYGFNLPFNGPKIDLPLLPAFDNPLDFLPGFFWAGPARGDIVTFWNPTPDFKPAANGSTTPNESSGIRMVKRVVGLPGDTIRVVDGHLQITDATGRDVPITYQPLDRGPYLVEPTGASRPTGRPGQFQVQPMKVPVEFELEYFGDEPHTIQFLQETQGWTPTGHQFRTVPRDGTAITLRDPDGRANDEYLMVGDNRDNSLDSRYYWEAYEALPQGAPVLVRGEHITGKAKFIAVSFHEGKFTRPAWSRWFRSFDGAAHDLAESLGQTP